MASSCETRRAICSKMKSHEGWMPLEKSGSRRRSRAGERRAALVSSVRERQIWASACLAGEGEEGARRTLRSSFERLTARMGDARGSVRKRGDGCVRLGQRGAGARKWELEGGELADCTKRKKRGFRPSWCPYRERGRR